MAIYLCSKLIIHLRKHCHVTLLAYVLMAEYKSVYTCAYMLYATLLYSFIVLPEIVLKVIGFKGCKLI